MQLLQLERAFLITEAPPLFTNVDNQMMIGESFLITKILNPFVI